MKIKTTKIISVLCILCFMVSCFCSCSSSQNIVDAVKKGDIEKADEIYLKEKERGADISELKYSIEEFLLQEVNAYNENTISQNDVQIIFENIVSCSFYSDFDLYLIETEFENLVNSKNSFSKAESLFEQAEYFEAIQLYEQVTSNDTNYDASQNKINESKKLLLSKVEAFVKKGDYLSAINLLKECCDSEYGEEFNSAYKKYVQEYIDKTIASVKEVFEKDKNYQNAIKSLKEALKNIEHADDSAFDPIYDEIDKYLEYEPIPLTSLEYTQKAEYIDLSHWDSTDVNEEEYEGDIFAPTGGTLASDTTDKEDEAYVTYYLNAKYSTFTGTIYRPYKTLSCPYDWKELPVFKVYGDGVLLYEGPKITQNTYDAIDFEVDVAGVRELKIVMMGVWTQAGEWIGQYDRYPKICAANLTLIK